MAFGKSGDGNILFCISEMKIIKILCEWFVLFLGICFVILPEIIYISLIEFWDWGKEK